MACKVFDHCSVCGAAVVVQGSRVMSARFLYAVCGAFLPEVVSFCVGVVMVSRRGDGGDVFELMIK